MLVRFCLLRRDPHSHSPQGVFQAAMELRDSGRLEPYEEEWLERDLSWLRMHLPSPDCLRAAENARAICWFKPGARRPIDKVRGIVALLQTRGVAVTMETTADPYQSPDESGARLARLMEQKAPWAAIEAAVAGRDCTFSVVLADDMETLDYLSFEVRAAEGIRFGYRDEQNKTAVRSLVERCARLLGYDVFLQSPTGDVAEPGPAAGGVTMTSDDLRRLETAIGRALPPKVREFFLNFPPGLRTPDEERDPDFSDFELTDDADALIRMNADGPENIWLPEAGPNFFALGSGGCGETWWVDLDDERGAVYFADAGTYARHSDHVADSLAEFAQGILDRRRTDG